MSLLYPPIGLSGRARSGKNTVAEFVRADLEAKGIPVRLRAFADPLRAALLALDPIVDPAGAYDAGDAWRLSELLGDESSLTWETIKDTPYGPEVRRLLQRLGTESIRALDPEFWVRATREDILAHPDHLTVLTDVRFPNEASLVQVLGYHYHVTRPDLTEDHNADHSSEAGVDALLEEADGEVWNTGTPSDLYTNVHHTIIRPYLRLTRSV